MRLEACIFIKIHSSEAVFLWTLRSFFRKIYPSKHSWWRRLENVKTSSRHFDQDEYIRLSHMSSEDVFNMFSKLFKMRCLQQVFKTYSRRLDDILKTYWRRLKDVFCLCLLCLCLAKTYWRRLQNVLKTSFKDVFNTSLRRFQGVSSG